MPIRKKGKLPHATVSVAYSLEYGLDEMEMHRDAVRRRGRIMLVDDLIATGGTAEAAVKLLRSLGAHVLAACFVIDLPELGGAARLAGPGGPGAQPGVLRGRLEGPVDRQINPFVYIDIRADPTEHYFAVIRPCGRGLRS